MKHFHEMTQFSVHSSSGDEIFYYVDPDFIVKSTGGPVPNTYDVRLRSCEFYLEFFLNNEPKLVKVTDPKEIAKLESLFISSAAYQVASQKVVNEHTDQIPW